MFSCLTPSCIKADNTKITIKSSCFQKPIKIVLNDDDIETTEVLEDIVKKILERKKTITEKKRNSVII